MKYKIVKFGLILTGAVFVVALLLFMWFAKGQRGGQEVVKNENHLKTQSIEKEEINYLLSEKFPERFFSEAKELEKIPQEVQEFLKDHYQAGSMTEEDADLYVFDLNDDASGEYIAIPWKLDGESRFRGASGNGSILVFGLDQEEFIVLGELQGNAFSVAKEMTNGYHDILVHYHMSAISGSETIYKFNENFSGKMEYQEDLKQMYELNHLE